MKRMHVKLIAVVVAVIALTAGSAVAAVIDLTFENIAPYPNNSDVFIQNYYNGGSSSIGTSGPNYGVSFPSNALLICLNSLSVICGSGPTLSNVSRGGLGDPNSRMGGLFFLTGSSTFLDYAPGFTTGFSFNYTAILVGGSVTVWSGLDGTGTMLASLTLPTTASGPCPGYNAQFCPFFPIGVSFAGTAKSIDFGGTANQIIFDDVTFGSSQVGTPEPSSLLLMGSGVLGLAGIVRRKLRR